MNKQIFLFLLLVFISLSPVFAVNYEKNTQNKEIITYKQVILDIKSGNKSSWRKNLSGLKASLFLQNTSLVQDIYQNLPKTERDWLVQLISSTRFFDEKKQESCAFYEQDLRRKRGEFLFMLLKNHSLDKKIIAKIMRELFVYLPESVNINTLENDNNWSANDYINRIEKLMIFGKNDEARSSFDEIFARKNKLLPAEICELRYQNAKLERKLRRYKSAREEFVDIANVCSDYTKQKARYLELLLTSMASDSEHMEKFDEFVSDYPTHGFSDDVLIFKANIYLDKNQNDKAQAVLDQVIKKYPDGDMIYRAYFIKAFDLAQRGQVYGALETLKNMKQVSPKNSLYFAQSEYWLARLSLFSNTKNLEITHPDNKNAAKKSLNSLVNSEYPSIYSWLSLSLLEKLGEKPKVRPIQNLISEKSLQINSSNTHVKFIEALILAGLKTEALAMLFEEVLEEEDVNKGLDLARLYYRLGEPQAAHQKTIRCHKNIADAMRENIPEVYEKISYPRVFIEETKWSNSYVDVPTNLVLAQMRQESGFLPQARSWAQASGLMQLMYPSAVEQINKLGIKNFNKQDLNNPKLNILLGSSVLHSYWQRFGNVVFAVAAYNAGPSAIAKWRVKNPGPLDTFIENVPFNETRDYLKSVLGSTFTYAKINNDSILPAI